MADTHPTSPEPAKEDLVFLADDPAPDSAEGERPGPKVPLKRRWLRPVMTEEQFLEERVEHLPTEPICADCRHLGEPIRITDMRGARRLRRACPHHHLGFTDLDWPVCAAFELAEGRSPARSWRKRSETTGEDPREAEAAARPTLDLEGEQP